MRIDRRKTRERARILRDVLVPALITLSQKGSRRGIEGTQLNGICDSRIQTHDLNTEDTSCIHRDRAFGYKMKQPQIVNILFTLKTKRRKRVHAVIQIIQVIMTTANIEWLNLTFKRRRRLTEAFCAVF